MRFYKVSGPDTLDITRTAFATSKDGAASKRKELNQAYGVRRSDIDTEEIDVEPTKAGICDALNEHCR